MNVSDAAPSPVPREVLGRALEDRIAALENLRDADTGFDAASWFWLVLLGILGPAALLVWGWIG